MSRITTVLRGEVDEAALALNAAWRFSNDERADFYAGRLAELLESAARHGVDTTRWVDPAMRAFASKSRG